MVSSIKDIFNQLLIRSKTGLRMTFWVRSVMFDFVWYKEKAKIPPSGYLKEQVLEKENQRILLCIPHPDDEVLGCYFFLQHEAYRQKIELLYVTKGNRCATAKNYTDIAEKRMHESRNALTGLPLEAIYQWDLDDGSLKEEKAAVRDRIERHVATMNYDIILSTASEDLTPDHAALGHMIQDITPREGVKKLFYRSTWSTFGIEEADYIYTGDYRTKKRAVKSFITQSHIPLLNPILFSALECRLAHGIFQPVEIFIDSDHYTGKSRCNRKNMLHWKQAKTAL